MDKNKDLAILVDKGVKKVKRDGWRGHLPKEREIKAEIYRIISIQHDSEKQSNISSPKVDYANAILKKVEQIFKIIREQTEY